MDEHNLLYCPNCNHQLDVDEMMAKTYEQMLQRRLAEERERVRNEVSEKQKLLEQQKQEFEQRKAKENELFKERLQKALLTERSQIKDQIAEDFKLQIQSSQDELKRKDERLAEMTKLQIELERAQREANLRQEQQKLVFERQLHSAKVDWEKEISAREKAQSDLKIAELNKQLDDQKKLVDEMKRKAEQGSMQLQGEILELQIEDQLRKKFPRDLIEEVSKGVRGADVIQTVMNDQMQACGKIIIESKRTKAYSEGWTDKLKQDMRAAGGDIAVLITETMPRDQEKMGIRDGVWVCSYQEYLELISLLRHMIQRLHHTKAANENKADKMEILYRFLISEEFKQQIESIIGGFSKLKDELAKEQRAMKRIWKEREKYIERILEGTIDMHASIQAISGHSLPTIDILELPDQGENEIDS